MKGIHNKLILLILFLIPLFLVFGCDGSLGLSGRVYEWTNVPTNETSKIYIVEKVSDNEKALSSILQKIGTDIEIQRLEGAGITVKEQWLGGWIGYVNSDMAGNFWLNDSTPGKGKVLVTVTKLGYIEVQGTANFEAVGSYEVVALLVKQKN